MLFIQSAIDQDYVSLSRAADGGEKKAGMWEEKFKTHHDSKPYGMHICV